MKLKSTNTKQSGIKLFSLLFVMLFIISSCNQNEDDVVPVQDNLPSLTEALEAFDEEVEYIEYSASEGQSNARWGYKRWKRKPTFFTLVSALNYTGLLKTVIQEKLTIFAPDDKAFRKLGLNLWNIRNIDKEALSNILLSHVVEGFVFSSDLPGCSIETINGSSIGLISMNGGLVLKDDSEDPINLLFTDRSALNSVFHGIDKVLTLGIPESTIGEIALSLNPDEFNELVLALQRTKTDPDATVDLLDAVLDENANLTVFAPIDEAFNKLYVSLGVNNVGEIPMNLLTWTLLHHVVDDRAFSYCLSDGLMVPTLNGNIEVDLDNPASIISSGGTIANLADTDITATNGVIHVINEVLVPQNVIDALTP